MNTTAIADAMRTLLAELVLGAQEPSFILNSGDVGMLRALDGLSASNASVSSHGGATIAAHADHVRYGFSLMNRWTGGESNPFADADWTQSWRIGAVSDEQWQAIRAALRSEAERWIDVVGTPREVTSLELKGMMGSIAHVGYHLGAIRQIHASVRGPTADESK